MITNPSSAEQQQNISEPSTVKMRIESLDVIRGIAVLAALFVSIWIFGGFSNQQQNQLLLQSKGWNFRVFAVVELLFDGKMRALISLVFGAAMILFLAKENAPGQLPAGDIFIRRQLWLILFGLINGIVLLWSQDILFHLGVMGILLFPFVKLTRRSLLIAAILVTLIYCGKNYWNYADDKKIYHKYLYITGLEKKFEKDSLAKKQLGSVVKKDTLTKMQKQQKGEWEGRLASMKVDVKKDEGNIKAMRENNYGKTWNYVLQNTQWREAGWLYQFGIWDFAGMILLGMFFYKAGFFNNQFSRSTYLILALTCLATGLLLGWYRLHFQQAAFRDYLKYINKYSLPHTIFFPVERALMATGYASLVVMLIPVGFLNRIWRAFASVGRMSLTNYLMQTIICTIFFYGYGMGYFARLTQFKLYTFAAEVIVVQVVFSVIWLRYYTYGPAEWLLRRLSYGKELPHSMAIPPAEENTLTAVS